MKRAFTSEMEDFRALCIEFQEMEETRGKELTSIQEQLKGFGYQPPAQTPVKLDSFLQRSPVTQDSAGKEVLEVTPGLYVVAGSRKPGFRESCEAAGGTQAPWEKYLSEQDSPSLDETFVRAAPQEERPRVFKNSERDSDGVPKEPKFSKYFYQTIGQSPPPSPVQSF